MKTILAIKCGRLINGTGADPLPDATLIIEGSRIIEIGENLSTPQDAKVLDASNRVVLPGLIDGHVHLNMDVGMSASQQLLASDAEVTLRAAKNARLTLEAGYTSILGNCGFGHYADLFLKHAIDTGWLPGPRLFTSGPQVTSTLRLGTCLKYGFPLLPFQVADGDEEMRKLVRRHIVSGVDWIKALATYDISSLNGEPALRNVTPSELEVIVEETHSQKRKVKAHLKGRETTKAALRAGIDVALHGFALDDDDVELMRRTGVTLIPTLAWMGEALRTSASGLSDWYLNKTKRYSASHIASFKRAHAAEVLIAAGTDCSGGGTTGDFLHHGDNAKELEYLVRYGFTPMNAIIAATNNVAHAFGLSHLLGTLEPGKLADLLIIKGDPLDDITILQDHSRIETIIKNGELAATHGVARAFVCPSLQPYSES
ncbi:MAG: amidohydrolase family protein [Candidatus Bathyarchaeota archaeon]|nr:MAG: amidohydrolase family protein [Candidatus Bathyarchaeota archaeon]